MAKSKMTYDVFDTRTETKVKTFKLRDRAHDLAERMNNEAGAECVMVYSHHILPCDRA